MQTYLYMIAAALVLISVVVIFLYLRSGFILLDLVRQDEEIWRQLDCPERVRLRNGDSTFLTIKPLFPWLGWIWIGHAEGLSQDMARRLVTTKKLLRGSLLLFAGTSMWTLGLMLSQFV